MVKIENLQQILKAASEAGGLLALVLLFLSPVIGFTLKYISDRTNTKDKENFQLSSKINQELWQKRLEAYMEVWSKMTLLSRRPQRVVKLEDMEGFQIFLRDWYFTNGIFLTRSSHKKFTELQDKVIKTLEVCKKENNKNATDLPCEEVRDSCSDLRKSFAGDIRARRDLPKD